MQQNKLVLKIPKWKIEKKNGVTLSLFFVIAAMENFSYLIPVGSYIIPGLIKLSDIGVLSAIVWCLYVFFFIKTERHLTYSKLPALYIVVLLLSATVSYRLFGQGFDLSIRMQRRFLVCILLYYAVTKVLSLGKVLAKDIKSMLCAVAVIEILVFTLQYVLSDSVQFLYVSFNSRYNDARLGVPYLLPLILTFFCVNEIMHGRNKVVNIPLALAGIFVLIVICKHRAPTMFLGLTLCIAYLIWKKGLSVKLFLGIVILALGIGFAASSTLVQDALDALLHNGKTSTLGIRIEGQLYYLERLKESPILGFGPPNENCSKAVQASGEEFQYYLADNGVMSCLYCHGLVGCVWLIALWVVVLRQSYYLYKKERKYHYLLYFIYETGNLYIGMHWFLAYHLPFFMMLTLTNYEYGVAKTSVGKSRRRDKTWSLLRVERALSGVVS